MIQNTSKIAFESILSEMGERQQTVFNYIKSNPDSCNLDISIGLNLPINQITPRVKELREMNFVSKSGT